MAVTLREMVSEATYLSPFDTKPFTIKNTTVAACSREKIRGTTIGSEFAFGKAILNFQDISNMYIRKVGDCVLMLSYYRNSVNVILCEYPTQRN